jgi:putative hydrolase of the HAD superfamily
MDHIKAVFFDLGGTLFSYRDMGSGNSDLIVRAAKELGAGDRDRKDIGRAYYRANKHAFKAFANDAYYLHQDLFREIFRRFAVELAGEPTAEYLDWSYREMRTAMVEGFKLRSDCLETLAGLRAAGLYVSIVSNIDDDFLEPMVERSGLGAFLDDWSSSEAAASCKPDRGFFDYALAKAGHEADAVLFVGDSPEHDIAGAKPLGMTTVLIEEAEGSVAPGQQGDIEADRLSPDHRIRTLSELLTLFGIDPQTVDRGAAGAT